MSYHIPQTVQSAIHLEMFLKLTLNSIQTNRSRTPKGTSGISPLLTISPGSRKITLWLRMLGVRVLGGFRA